ncbi:MAG TPA: AAA family ATPase [Vicinamibacterales bacterium]
MSSSASGRAAVTGAQTYEDYYGFAHSPFTPSPDPQFLYLSPTHDDALKRLRDGVVKRTGFAVVTGEAGIGKTILARTLVATLDRASFGSLILNPFLSIDELVRELLLDFGVMSRDDVRSGRASAASRDELVGTLRAFLSSVWSIGGHGVLILDEAQHLPPDVLDHVRRIAAMDEAGRCPLQVVLLGEPPLLDALETPALQPFGGRVSTRVRLTPLSRPDTEAYIAHRLSVARATTTVSFDGDALDEVHALSRGVPRVVNQICDRALALCARDQVHAVGVDAIRGAARALELLPPEQVVESPAPRRRWYGMLLASLLAVGVFLAFAPLVDWIDAPLPDLPGVPHVVVRPPAEARPIPPTLEDALPASMPLLPLPALQP